MPKFLLTDHDEHHVTANDLSTLDSESHDLYSFSLKQALEEEGFSVYELGEPVEIKFTMEVVQRPSVAKAPKTINKER